jgi:hypothetical protein
MIPQVFKYPFCCVLVVLPSIAQHKRVVRKPQKCSAAYVFAVATSWLSKLNFFWDFRLTVWKHCCCTVVRAIQTSASKPPPSAGATSAYSSAIIRDILIGLFHEFDCLLCDGRRSLVLRDKFSLRISVPKFWIDQAPTSPCDILHSREDVKALQLWTS